MDEEENEDRPIANAFTLHVIDTYTNDSLAINLLTKHVIPLLFEQAKDATQVLDRRWSRRDYVVYTLADDIKEHAIPHVSAVRNTGNRPSYIAAWLFEAHKTVQWSLVARQLVDLIHPEEEPS